jgi:hypothetical protein
MFAPDELVRRSARVTLIKVQVVVAELAPPPVGVGLRPQ